MTALQNSRLNQRLFRLHPGMKSPQMPSFPKITLEHKTLRINGNLGLFLRVSDRIAFRPGEMIKILYLEKNGGSIL
jgi:hypothetical protein